ncbi:MAG TPA: acylphosphatase [Isosphaeraceae bacterium]|jgi:acylphosphatase
MPTERRRVWYEGRVQGVGFRYTARRLAGGFPVSGYVRNLADGRVELLAEGDVADVAAFLDAIAREMGHFIRGVDSRTEPSDEPLPRGFTIRS